MRRWLPHVHFGEVSGECVRDHIEEGGREGYYFEICWLGWMVGFTLSSLRWERQSMERIRKKYGGTA